jgi:hypothetical protein
LSRSANGFALAEGVEDAGLDKAEDGFEVGCAVSLLIDLDGGGVLADGFDGEGVAVVAGAEFGEGAFAGLQGEAALGAGKGEFLDDEAVRVLGAEVEDEGLFFLGEPDEHVKEFHTDKVVSGWC